MVRVTGLLLSIIAIQLLLLHLAEAGSLGGRRRSEGRKRPPPSEDVGDADLTNAIFSKDETLNCFGIPNKMFADKMEAHLTDVTNAEDVRFYFATRQNTTYNTVRVINNEFSLKNTNYNISRKTVVLVHGWRSSGQADWLRDMMNATLRYVWFLFNSYPLYKLFFYGE